MSSSPLTTFATVVQTSDDQQQQQVTMTTQEAMVDALVADLSEQLLNIPIEQCKISLEIPLCSFTLGELVPVLKALVDKFHSGFTVELSYVMMHSDDLVPLARLAEHNYEDGFDTLLSLGVKPVFKQVECRLKVELLSEDGVNYQAVHVNPQPEGSVVKLAVLIEPLRLLKEKLDPSQFVLSASCDMACEMDDHARHDWQCLLDLGATITTALPFTTRPNMDNNQPVDVIAQEVLHNISRFMSSIPKAQLHVREIVLDVNIVAAIGRSVVWQWFTGELAECFASVIVITFIQSSGSNNNPATFDLTLLSPFRDSLLELYFPLTGQWTAEHTEVLPTLSKLTLLSMGLPTNDITSVLASLTSVHTGCFHYGGSDSSDLLFVSHMTGLKIIVIQAPNLLDIASLAEIGERNSNAIILTLNLGDQVDSLDSLGNIPTLVCLSMEGGKTGTWRLPVMPSLAYLDLEKFAGEITDHYPLSKMPLLQCYKLPELKVQNYAMMLDICEHAAHVKIVHGMWTNEEYRQSLCKSLLHLGKQKTPPKGVEVGAKGSEQQHWLSYLNSGWRVWLLYAAVLFISCYFKK